MNNPYEVLGIKPGASNAEIKAAYKELVKKYHPDKYQNNPLADLAEEKLQEVNEAYDMLMKQAAGATGSGGQASSAYGNPYGRQSYGQQNYGQQNYGGTGNYGAIRQLIDMGDLARAEQMLINAPGRDAEWFFLSGVISFRKGYADDGLTNVRQAIDMDPDNFEYQRVYRQMTAQGAMYRTRSNGQGYNNRNSDMCSDCCTLYLCSSCISPCW